MPAAPLFFILPFLRAHFLPAGGKNIAGGVVIPLPRSQNTGWKPRLVGGVWEELRPPMFYAGLVMVANDLNTWENEGKFDEKARTDRR